MAHLSRSGWEGTTLEPLRAQPALGCVPENDHEQPLSSLRRCVMAVTTDRQWGREGGCSLVEWLLGKTGRDPGAGRGNA